MLRFATRLAFGIGALSLALGLGSTARADFDIHVAVPGSAIPGGFVDIFDNDGVYDTDLAIGIISVNTTLLNQTLAAAGAGYEFNTLGANLFPNDPSEAALNISGLAQRTSTGTFSTISISASANDYSFPFGPTATLQSTASVTFGGLGATSQFVSYFDAGNTQFATTVASGPLVFAPPPLSQGADAAPTVIAGGVFNPFALTNTTVLTMAAGSQVKFGGTTTLQAVPEPGSIALLLGGSALAFGIHRRRKAA